MAEISFAEDRKTIRAALARALAEEAQHRSLSVDPALFDPIAAAFDAQNDSPPGLAPPTRADLTPLFGDSPPLALLLFDTPGIQDYLFKVSGPIDLFGGSRQVADFTEKGKELSIFRRLAPPWPIEQMTVFAGGGSGLLLVSASEAEELAGRIESILVEATAGDLRTYAAYLPVWPDEILAHSSDEALAGLLFPGAGQREQGSKPPSAYAAVLASLLQELQRRRNQQQPWPARQSVDAQFSRCEACGDRPGSLERKRGEDLEKLCPSCHSRWKYGQTQRGKLDEKRTFEALLEGIEPPVTALAVIYADGANAGDPHSVSAELRQRSAQKRQKTHPCNLQPAQRRRLSGFARRHPAFLLDRRFAQQIPATGRRKEGRAPLLHPPPRPCRIRRFPETHRNPADRGSPGAIQAIRRELPRGRQLSLSLWRYQQARSEDWANWRKALGIPSLATIDDHLWRRGLGSF